MHAFILEKTKTSRRAFVNVFLYVRKSIVMRARGANYLNFFKENRFLIIVIMISLILRFLWLTSLIERDEGSGGYVAMLWSRGFLPYLHSLDNKGPLHYAFYLLANYFDNPAIAIRIINNVLFIVSIIGLYLLGKDWYGQKVGIASALFYGIFMNVPVLEGIHAKSDSLLQPFLIFSIYFCWRFVKTRKKGMLLFSSILMSLAFLINIRMIVGFAVLLIMVIIHTKKSLGSLISNIILLIVGAVIPIIVVSAYLLIHGALNAAMEVLVFRSVGLFVAERLPMVFGPKFFLLIEALPLWLFAVLGVAFSVTEMHKKGMTILTWLLIFLLVIFLISPFFAHRFLPLVAPASIFAGMGLISILDESFYKKWRRPIITVIIILIVTSVPSIQLQIMQYPNFNYDIQLWWHGSDFDSFEQQIELANYLKSHTSEDGQILVHGWAPEIYWLSSHKAPSLYVWSIGEQAIPNEAYQELLNLVKQSAFEYIVLTQPHASDPITATVLAGMHGYYCVKSIGPANIYTNKMEILKSVIIVDDNQTDFWEPGATGEGTIGVPVLSDNLETVTVGTNSLKMEIGSGSYAYPVISHYYDTSQDWSEYNFIRFWWFGQNSGKRIEIVLWTPNLENWVTYYMMEDWLGWEQITVPLEGFKTVRGTYDLTRVALIQIWFGDNTRGVWYIDQVSLIKTRIAE